MPTPTYVALAKTVLTGTQANVTLASIVNTYTDLLLVISARGTDAATRVNLKVEFNANSSAIYSETRLIGYDGVTLSGRDQGNTFFQFISIDGAGATSDTFSNNELYIPNYTGAANKVISSSYCAENNNAGTYILGVSAHLFGNTSPVSSIKLTPASGSFVTGSRFDLYGIKNS